MRWALALALACLVACDPTPPPQLSLEEAIRPDLVIVTDLDPLLLEPLLQAWEKRVPARSAPRSINVHYVLGELLEGAAAAEGDRLLDAAGVARLREQLGALGHKDSKPIARANADLVLCRDASTLAALEQAGLLAPLGAIAGSDELPAEYRGERWLGLSLRLASLARRTKRLPEGPAGWRELGSEAMRNKLRWAETDDLELQAWAAGWLASDAAAARKLLSETLAGEARPDTYPTGPRMDQAWSSSKKAAPGVLVGHDLFAHPARGPRTDRARFASAVLDPEAATASITAVGLLASATPDHLVLARDFIAFASSAAGQQLLVAGDDNFVGSGQLPLRPGVPAPTRTLELQKQLASGAIKIAPSSLPGQRLPHLAEARRLLAALAPPD